MNPISQLIATSHQRAATHPASRRTWVASSSGPRDAAHDSERTPGMTHDTPKGWAAAGRQDAVGRIRAAVARLTAGIHAAGDERAHAAGWTVTATTGRFGLSARTYRDPRFGSPAPVRPAVATPEGSRGATATRASQPPTVARASRTAAAGQASRRTAATGDNRVAAAARESWPAAAEQDTFPATAARGSR